MTEEIERLGATMVIAHPEPAPGSPAARHVTGLERADALLRRVAGAPDDTGADLSATGFGRVSDAAIHLVAVEDDDGAVHTVHGEPRSRSRNP